MSFFHIKTPVAVLLTCVTTVNAMRKYRTSVTRELSNTKNIIINPILWNLPKSRSKVWSLRNFPVRKKEIHEGLNLVLHADTFLHEALLGLEVLCQMPLVY